MHGKTDDNAIGLARRLIGISRRRNLVFGRGALSELQWDMLLRLLVEPGESGLAERALLVGGGKAAAEASRHLDLLVEQGLVWRVAGLDGCRYIHLSSAARSRAIRVLDGLPDLAEDMRNTIQTAAYGR